MERARSTVRLLSAGDVEPELLSVRRRVFLPSVTRRYRPAEPPMLAQGLKLPKNWAAETLRGH